MIDIDDKVLADLRSGFSIPAKPEILQSLQDELNKDEPELNRVAAIITEDVATSAAVLKVINSPAYGMSRTVTDIKQAVMFLGMNCITQVVTGHLLKSAFAQDDCCISLQRFWDSASDISQVAMLIGKKANSAIPIEDLQLLGLFHDAGVPAMAMRFEDYNEVLMRAAQRPEHSLIEYEAQQYATNHTVVGYYLASSWHLPKRVCQIILRHHDPSFFQDSDSKVEKQIMATLKLAENFCFEIKHFRSCADWHTFKDDVMLALDLSDDDYTDIKEDVEEYLIG
ncbi:HDOD domain-containing protein [Pseudoalteromonas luteoviolacea]|uniref:HDOD domain-containing protein n=1 Tax=Pseudoalteromonas luteoviolacea TaxID=43657 RepID=UPI001F393D0E|nr:HDOD domain-containing protein [Pseudoalteromonas luteoviolacea]MCF6440220.1 HDOD domain-containing protein [Pseudoalteromonas luteoviolacea]